MPKLLEPETFRRRYFERGGPSDEELKQGIANGTVRGAVICGKVYVADDALFNKEPWQPKKRSNNPLLAAVR